MNLVALLWILSSLDTFVFGYFHILYVYNMHSVNTLRNLLDTLRQVHCRLAVITKLQSSHTIAHNLPNNFY